MVTPQAGADTRERIFAAVVDLVRADKAPSMAAVARAAGVSRQTLYLHFGDRVGLFSDLIPYLTSRNPDLPVLGSALSLPAREAFEQHFRGWIAVAAHIGRYASPLWAAMADDPEMVEGVRERDNGIRTIYLRLFEKLDEEGLLKPSWAIEEAADAAWSMTLYLLTVNHIRMMRGWTVEEIADRQLKLLGEAFLREEAP